MSTRTQLSKWPRPDHKTLMEKKYKQGNPKFAPFPQVTNVMNAALCPIAILHDILHGIDDALLNYTSSPLNVGNLFHEFVAHLKSKIAEGRQYTSLQNIRYEYEMFARSQPDNVKNDCWRYYLERWCQNKLTELRNIPKNANIFFEVYVANAYVPFLGSRKRTTYPLLGVIDEMNFEDSKLIERTIKGKPRDADPPKLKDYQLWLLWKILCSIEKKKYPEAWRDVDFKKFDLIVETPFSNYTVDKQNPEFEELTHVAYAWIHDISFERKAIYEAYLPENRTCTLLKKEEECNLRNTACYRGAPKYPTSRDEVKKEFRQIYRSLFQELLWNKHLFRYQLTQLERNQLEDLGYISVGKVISIKNGKTLMEFGEKQTKRILAQHASGDIGGYSLVFGTFHIGIRSKAFIEEQKNNGIVFSVERKRIPSSQNAILVQLDPEAAVFENQPWFLTRNQQKELYKLERWGLFKPDRAESQSVIQMLESIFGTKPLRRENSARDKRSS